MDASIPLLTAIPIERLAFAPAPVANTKGITPRIKANEVIIIGRKRILALSKDLFNQDGKISSILKKIAQLEESLYDMKIIFKDASKGWKAAA